MNKPRVIDLFCGAGGFSHGFQSAGFKIVLGVDNWKGCEETFRHNHEGAEFWLKDINEVDPHDLPKADVIIGSPPCQNFSITNPKKDEVKGFELVDRFLKIVEHYEPEYWILENLGNSPKLRDHLDGFPKMVVYCSDFGLNTIRRRLFCGDFPQSMSMGTIDRKKALPSITTKIPKRDWTKTRKQRNDWLRRGIDPDEITLEFSAEVQTFPKSFKFIGSDSAIQKMIGNAVPPEMAFILANAILEDMREASS